MDARPDDAAAADTTALLADVRRYSARVEAALDKPLDQFGRAADDPRTGALLVAAALLSQKVNALDAALSGGAPLPKAWGAGQDYAHSAEAMGRAVAAAVTAEREACASIDVIEIAQSSPNPGSHSACCMVEAIEGYRTAIRARGGK